MLSFINTNVGFVFVTIVTSVFEPITQIRNQKTVKLSFNIPYNILKTTKIPSESIIDSHLTSK